MCFLSIKTCYFSAIDLTHQLTDACQSYNEPTRFSVLPVSGESSRYLFSLTCAPFLPIFICYFHGGVSKEWKSKWPIGAFCAFFCRQADYQLDPRSLYSRGGTSLCLEPELKKIEPELEKLSPSLCKLFINTVISPIKALYLGYLVSAWLWVWKQACRAFPIYSQSKTLLTGLSLGLQARA